jgi:hypothetical protein
MNATIRLTFTTAAAALALMAIPAAALANPAQDDSAVAEISAVDAVAADTSTDGKADETSPDVAQAAGDSPMVDSYSNNPEDPLPPPAECGDKGVVCGGGDNPPTTPEGPEVDGGGSPDTTDVGGVNGGGAELPFTGLPLYTTVLAGALLILFGLAAWVRTRTSARQ